MSKLQNNGVLPDALAELAPSIEKSKQPEIVLAMPEFDIFTDNEAKTFAISYGNIDEAIDLLSAPAQANASNSHPEFLTWLNSIEVDPSTNGLIHRCIQNVTVSAGAQTANIDFGAVIRGSFPANKLDKQKLKQLKKTIGHSKKDDIEFKEHYPNGRGFGFNIKIDSSSSVSVEISRLYIEDTDQELTTLSVGLTTSPEHTDISDVFDF
jgi:hypothetical protein